MNDFDLEHGEAITYDREATLPSRLSGASAGESLARVEAIAEPTVKSGSAPWQYVSPNNLGLSEPSGGEAMLRYLLKKM